jgi:hypothetical protein
VPIVANRISMLGIVTSAVETLLDSPRCTTATTLQPTLQPLLDIMIKDKRVSLCIQLDLNFRSVVISFRGTVPTSIKNWIDDVVYAKADCDFQGLTCSGKLSRFLQVSLNCS